MPLAGQLSTMPLPDLLQWVQSGRKSGRAEFRGANSIRGIYFRSGKVIASESSEGSNQFGTHLMEGGFLTSEEFAKARDVAENGSTSLGSILVGIGLLTEREVKRLLKRKLENEFADIASWREGDFVFVEDTELSSEFIPLDEDPIKLFLAVQRQIDLAKSQPIAGHVRP